MKARFLSVLLVSLMCVGASTAHEIVIRARTPVNIPDIPGYLTLKCDFHTHTVFSDGNVWPSIRSEEAWREGLDAIAITDHIEYQPHKADVSTNHNRSYEIARGAGDNLDLLVIKGSEITRSMPPGHLNAIFLTNSEPLAVSDWTNSVREAHRQGAFVFWNHPGWEAQLIRGVITWFPEHTWLVEQDFLQGIEVVNGRDYYPEAHRWAIEKKLTMLSNSDIHMPLNMDYHVHEGDHRPVTLVFAKDRTPEAIKEALFARRTAAYSGDRLIGDEQFLKPIFDRSIQFSKTNVTLIKRDSTYLQIRNDSDIYFELEQIKDVDGLQTPKSIILAGGKTVLFEIRAKDASINAAKSLELTYRVKNLLIGPNEPMKVTFPLNVTFASASQQ